MSAKGGRDRQRGGRGDDERRPVEGGKGGGGGGVVSLVGGDSFVWCVCARLFEWGWVLVVGWGWVVEFVCVV